MTVVEQGMGGRDDVAISELEYRVDVLHVIGDAVSAQTCCQAIHGAYRRAVYV